MQMRKKLNIFKHFAKSKKWFFCQYLSFSVWFLFKFPKKYKIEAPYCWLYTDFGSGTLVRTVCVPYCGLCVGGAVVWQRLSPVATWLMVTWLVVLVRRLSNRNSGMRSSFTQRSFLWFTVLLRALLWKWKYDKWPITSLQDNVSLQLVDVNSTGKYFVSVVVDLCEKIPMTLAGNQVYLYTLVVAHSLLGSGSRSRAAKWMRIHGSGSTTLQIWIQILISKRRTNVEQLCHTLHLPYNVTLGMMIKNPLYSFSANPVICYFGR
jgi:hypothetical protein